jgi:hypothetical protein
LIAPLSTLPLSDSDRIKQFEKQLQWAELKIQVLEERLRLQLIAKYGSGGEKLSDAQLELLEREPGVSSVEVQAESEREPLPTAANRKKRPHPGRQALKGNRFMRRLLNQAANAAVKVKGSIFEIVFRRLLPRLGFKQAIWAIAHRLSRLIWKILHQGVSYEERGPAVSQKSRAARTTKMIKELRSLGYLVEPVRKPA